MKNKRLAMLALVMALALFVPSCGVICPKVEVVPQGVTNYTGIEIDVPSGDSNVGLDVDQNGTSDVVSFKDGGTEVFDIADGGIADFKNNAPTNLGAAGTDFTSTGGLTLAGPLAASPGAANTVLVYGSAITPLTSSVVITAASTITNATMAACTVNGQLVIIAIAGDSDITITESSTLYAGGSIALDASEFDAVALMCVGSKWRKIAAFADN